MYKKITVGKIPVRKLKIKERRQQDLNFRLSEILRSKIHKMLKNKKTSYSKYLGCDVEMLKKWLEFRFDTNMNWTNVGEYWHIDHIIPINKFDFSKEDSAPDLELNQVIWKAVRGEDSEMPAPRRAALLNTTEGDDD